MSLITVKTPASFCVLHYVKTYPCVSITAVRHFTAQPVKPRKEKAAGHTVCVNASNIYTSKPSLFKHNQMTLLF